MADENIAIVPGWCGQDCKCLILSKMKAADAKMDKEISQYKKLDSHLSKKLSEENQKVEDLQKELEVWWIIRS